MANKKKMTEEDVLELLKEDESEFLEFKVNNTHCELIGEYISALANSAQIHGRRCSYMLWGINDDKKVVGTTFKPKSQKHKSQPFITWLERNIDPELIVDFHEVKVTGLNVVVMQIHMNANRPVSFQGKRWIRSGSSKKPLKDHPEKERELWLSFVSSNFESEIAKHDCSVADVSELLDTDSYKKHFGHPIGLSENKTLDEMEKDGLVVKSSRKYNITNLGAYTFAKSFSDFPRLHWHAPQVVKYKGNNQIQTLKEASLEQGVAVGFEAFLKQTRDLLPESLERLVGAKMVSAAFPDIAIRELLANQLVHQDFSVKGSRPTVSICDNRVEFSNAGAPLNNADRLLDMKEISRNPQLADLFKKMGFVEARGCGIDRAILSLEEDHLPAPSIKAEGNTTVVKLYPYKNINEYTPKQTINTVYWHAARLYAYEELMSNTTLRERLGLGPKEGKFVYKIIKLALRGNKIKEFDEEAGPKYKRYV
ncbi:MAG: putative DNA binding domain-containing protein, partial [Micrococcaceae bacterium]